MQCLTFPNDNYCRMNTGDLPETIRPPQLGLPLSWFLGFLTVIWLASDQWLNSTFAILHFFAVKVFKVSINFRYEPVCLFPFALTTVFVIFIAKFTFNSSWMKRFLLQSILFFCINNCSYLQTELFLISTHTILSTYYFNWCCACLVSQFSNGSEKLVQTRSCHGNRTAIPLTPLAVMIAHHWKPNEGWWW